ncbi:MAG: nickel transporter [Methanospirillum sp.]|nr:nickel transporter [Methanospirillum sp.]
MDLYLATDLKSGSIVHGKSGMRDQYVPVRSIHADTADPHRFLEQVRPKYLYVADLDRICRTGDHDRLIPGMAERTCQLLLDRGCRGHDDLLSHPRVKNIIGTETAGEILDTFSGGVLSVDMKDGRVIPWNADPAEFLSSCSEYPFEMVILLDIGGVGTKKGLDSANLSAYRESYAGSLLWGGGVGSVGDLFLLSDLGYDGAIIATAVHTGVIPVEYIRRGKMC